MKNKNGGDLLTASARGKRRSTKKNEKKKKKKRVCVQAKKNGRDGSFLYLKILALIHKGTEIIFMIQICFLRKTGLKSNQDLVLE